MDYRKMGVLVAATSAVMLSSASAATAATAPLRATGDGGGPQRALKSHVVGYALSSAWTRYGTVSGNATTDTYYRDHRVGDVTCRLLLTAAGQLTKGRPSVASGSVVRADYTFAIDRRGRAGSLRWYLGATRAGSSVEGIAAMGYERVSPKLRSASRKYVVFDMRVSVETRSAACDGAPDKYAGTLGQAIRTAEVRSR
ncbi:MAG: hypothetical protein JHC84_18950 [Solirubrobacteraceae bacterium]|nr:hypothetical protein [Solirubrobacteraceae bacterium]